MYACAHLDEKRIDLNNLDTSSQEVAVKTDLIIQNRVKDEINQKIYTTETVIKVDKETIITNSNMITTLKKEEEIEKVFKVYLEMIGKKGISKLVLRSVLPIINSELTRLLDDVCNFEIELIR